MRRAITVALSLVALAAMPMSAANEDAVITGTWFDGLEPGICFEDVFNADGDFDFSVPAPAVPCAEPHANEVVARVPLAAGEFSEEGLIAQADELCVAEYEEFLGRPVETTLMYPFSVAPSASDWDAGARDALCIVYAGEPVRGSAASGSLKAPGEVLAAYHEVEQKPDLWLIDAGSGLAIKNITDNEADELITSPSWSPDGRSVVYSRRTGAQGEESDGAAPHGARRS